MKALIPESEENLIIECIYTTYLIQNLESDYVATERLKFKIPEAWENFIESKLKELRKQLVAIKAEMKKLRIKVADPVRVNEDFVEYAYFPHGYEGRMRFWDAAMRMEGTRRLKELFKVQNKA